MPTQNKDQLLLIERSAIAEASSDGRTKDVRVVTNGIDLQEINSDYIFNGKDLYLRFADLEGANLGDARLQKADLKGANLRKANVDCAFLKDAKLNDVDATEATFLSTAFRDANVSNANFTRARLSLHNFFFAQNPNSIASNSVGIKFHFIDAHCKNVHIKGLVWNGEKFAFQKPSSKMNLQETFALSLGKPVLHIAQLSIDHLKKECNLPSDILKAVKQYQDACTRQGIPLPRYEPISFV